MKRIKNLEIMKTSEIIIAVITVALIVAIHLLTPITHR